MDNRILAEIAYNKAKHLLSPDNGLYGLSFKDLPVDVQEVCTKACEEVRCKMYERLEA